MQGAQADGSEASYTGRNSTTVEAPKSHAANYRLPSLDGLRAIAILLVLVGHSNVRPRVLTGRFAELGVSIFFVISGYIITHLLVKEQQRTGEINLRAFYLRRIFRILPVIYVYVAFVALLGALHRVSSPNTAGFIASLTFLWGFIPGSSDGVNSLLNHTWSLSIEEQFYLLWPCCLAWLGRRYAGWIALALIAFSPLFRIVLYQFSAVRGFIGWTLYSRPDSLMFGCALALYEHGRLLRSAREALKKPPLVILVIGVLFWAAFAIPVWYEARWDAYTIHGACTALLLLHFVHDPNTFNGRVLNSRPLVWVGLISYSLYAWQQLFFFGFRASWLRSLPAKWVGAFTVACLSYFLVERWSLRVRQRFTARYASQRP